MPHPHQLTFFTIGLTFRLLGNIYLKKTHKTTYFQMCILVLEWDSLVTDIVCNKIEHGSVIIGC